MVVSKSGRRIRVSTGCSDEKEARKFLTRLKAQYLDAPKRSDKTWSDALIKWLKAKPRSDSDKLSIDALGYKDRPLHKCTAESFEALFDDDWAPATYNRYIARIAAILNLSGVRIKFDKKSVGTGRIRFLTAAEWGRLYGVLPAHLQPIALFSILTSLRRHNVTHLEWSQIDMGRQVMWVHPDQAKGGKPISVPIPNEAMSILKAQAGADKTYVFVYKGKPIVSPKRGFTDACVLAEVKDFTWHGLRHTWASWHVMRGTPLTVLQALGGWTDQRMVQRYAHLDPCYVTRYANNAVPWSSENGQSE